MNEETYLNIQVAAIIVLLFVIVVTVIAEHPDWFNGSVPAMRVERRQGAIISGPDNGLI
jgi:hypothetical protein